VSYTEITGDLFALDLPAIGHGCNCQGVMGAGVAGQMRKRWPVMYNEYRDLCKAGKFRPGNIFPWEADEVCIYNLATQDRPGPDASLDAIRTCVREMLIDAEVTGLPQVGVPRLGTGIGGLSWHDVAPVLRELAGRSSCELTVVTLPVEARG
jgi:O-acetyl-ADP-ribose deacetylase (regulator of RNase III)